ncbi:hypothetical protein C2845_PM11G21840 [Panicum miliaceum]|uniref:Auxin-responsive protein n=1 Tax=Panicum miliaceum TaxID=4540 RepID=A0A3L6RNR9_PANMI|nr:hypothetical protein C2845_PM11G21840 [Panicum miliaceum]
MRGGAGPTVAFIAGDRPPDAAAAEEEEVEENSGGEEEEQEDDELELGLCLGSKKQQQPPSPAPCRILTARDLQPGALSPDSSVSSSSPAAGAAAASKRAKADTAPNATTSPGTVASGHPQRKNIISFIDELRKSTSTNLNGIFRFGSSFGVVGWPPIRTFRMNSLFNQAKDNASEAHGTKKAADESDMQKDKEESEKKGRVIGWVKVRNSKGFTEPQLPQEVEHEKRRWRSV